MSAAQGWAWKHISWYSWRTPSRARALAGPAHQCTAVTACVRILHFLPPRQTARTWGRKEAKHITLALTLETTPSKDSTFIPDTGLEYDLMPSLFPQGQRCFRKTANFGQLWWGHHVQHWKWNEEITEQKVPTYSCGGENGKRETENKRIKNLYIPRRNHLVV